MKNFSLTAPPYLSVGDKIGVVSLASVLDEDRLLKGEAYLEEKFGLEVVFGKNILNKKNNYAGTDEERLSDFQDMLDNPEIKAIIAGRGGYGSSRIIDKVNWGKFMENPKWVVGFSDITAVHSQIQKLGFQSIHGPMVVTVFMDDRSAESLRQALFGENLSYHFPATELNKTGLTEGQLVGGNLCLLNHLLSTPSEISFDGRILFLEEISEYLYNIDRMLVQLKRAGKLANLKGLLVGHFSDSRENATPFGKTAYEIIAEHTEEYNFPVAYGIPVGHEDSNLAIRCGEWVSLAVRPDSVDYFSQGNGFS